jgi:Sulfotransferase family
MRIVHIHLPKTAGTALRLSFQNLGEPKLRICPARLERQFKKQNFKDFDVFSGHMSYATAQKIGGDVITVLRDPIDRFLSIYYFWRSLYEKNIERTKNTTLAINFPIKDFVSFVDDKGLIEAFYNRMTWQLAYTWELEPRNEWRIANKLGNDGLLETAIQNLSKFKVVGFQEHYSDVLEKLNALYGTKMVNKAVNVTETREKPRDIDPDVLAKIRDWVRVDIKLYEYALKTYAPKSREMSQESSVPAVA